VLPSLLILEGGDGLIVRARNVLLSFEFFFFFSTLLLNAGFVLWLPVERRFQLFSFPRIVFFS